MDTAGQFTLIDMHVPPGGGPPPHRHDFMETFFLLDGELQATFRGEKRIVRAGETVHIPANAPHQFYNGTTTGAGATTTGAGMGIPKLIPKRTPAFAAVIPSAARARIAIVFFIMFIHSMCWLG
jgi:hypothetical protein